VSRGAEDAKDAVSDAGDKLKNAGSNAGDDSEGQLKKAQKNVSRAAEDAKDNVQVRGLAGMTNCCAISCSMVVLLDLLSLRLQHRLH
jgi:hypothetical protein